MIRSPQDFGAGVFLLLMAAAAIWGSIALDMGTLRAIGPGMLPRATAILVAAFGTFLIITSFFVDGSPLDRWRIRGPIFVLGAALLFAWTIRPLGLIIAGPLCLIFGSLADKDTRIVEIVIFSIVMTVACIGVFNLALGLPIPIMPTGLPYPFDSLMAR